MKIFCVRIGEKYGVEYEHYLEAKLPQYEFNWIREPFHPSVMLQWNKMLPMGLKDIDEPICVLDIDLILINDYIEIFEYPIQRGEFLAMPDWWNTQHAKNGYTLNGGFFKYYPKDVYPIYKKFMEDPKFWQQYYIKNGITTGPVNGEQYFVEDSVIEEGLTLKLLPKSWFTRWATPKSVSNGHMWDAEALPGEYVNWQHYMNKKYIAATGNEFLMLGDFHDDIKMVHFTHSINKPHEWEHYNDYK